MLSFMILFWDKNLKKSSAQVFTYSSRAASSLHSVYKPERCQRSFYKACLLESHNRTCTSSWRPHSELAALETCCQLKAKNKPLMSTSFPADMMKMTVWMTSVPVIPDMTQPMFSVILNKCVTVEESSSLSWKKNKKKTQIVLDHQHHWNWTYQWH